MKFKSENGDTTFYTYDNLGNLISVLMSDGTFIEYLIDGQNRRIGKLVNGQYKKGWIYQDQINPVAELDSLGNISSRFVYGSKGHVPDYIVKNGVTYSFVTDHLGSVRFVTDIATGNVVQSISYDEFGNVLSDTNPEFQSFGYAGGLYDETTGLVRFGARDYDAGVGRWTAKDPIGFGGGDVNFYIYSINSPLNYIDINGLNGCRDFVESLIGDYLASGDFIDLGRTFLSKRSTVLSDYGGFKPELTAGEQGGEVSQHVYGHAGAILQYGIIMGVAASLANEVIDRAQPYIQSGRTQAESKAEVSGDRAARKVAGIMRRYMIERKQFERTKNACSANWIQMRQELINTLCD